MKKILTNLLILSLALTTTTSLVSCQNLNQNNKSEENLPTLPSNFTILQGDIYQSFGIRKQEGSQKYFFKPTSDQLSTLFLNLPQRKIAPLGFAEDVSAINDFRVYLDYPFAATFTILSDQELTLDENKMVNVTLAVKCLKVAEKWFEAGVWKMRFTDMNVEQKVTFKIPIIPNESDELNEYVLKKYKGYIEQNNIEIDKSKLDFNDLSNAINTKYLEEKAKTFIDNFISENKGLNKKLNLKKIIPPKGNQIKKLDEPANSLVKIPTTFNFVLNIEGLDYQPRLSLGMEIRYKIM
ncbi:hypothetical protein [Spiroplasma sp. SV19]|uniref:hypothetical protein n=1 Tax=Spiroplasma sp. SV19 TaxID=2570468 RepID=UPI0024B6E2E9|nr:hypothetical protein [Spiroplasma sp. SV19]WHQ37112.1 hypothetical protein E7Y35_04370 [Spiroplasma sp. SV19]